MRFDPLWLSKIQIRPYRIEAPRCSLLKISHRNHGIEAPCCFLLKAPHCVLLKPGQEELCQNRRGDSPEKTNWVLLRTKEIDKRIIQNFIKLGRTLFIFTIVSNLNTYKYIEHIYKNHIKCFHKKYSNTPLNLKVDEKEST